jgi:hypothetical protein
MSTLLAAAFHESVSVAKLDELFRSDWNSLFGGTTAGHCPKCRCQFAVFFQASDDPQNLEYLKSLEGMMSQDCRDGTHTRELYLNQGSAAKTNLFRAEIYQHGEERTE